MVLCTRINKTKTKQSINRIWDKFVEFESFVGDLTSVLKVEKRKAAALKAEVREVWFVGGTPMM